jgi:dCMP deaminase
MTDHDGRSSWDEYFMQITFDASLRSTCLRRRVGAIIVRDKQILTTGYNGAPSGITHCHENGGCLREQRQVPSGEKEELCRALHAEQNAIIQAAKHGINIDKGTLYSTTYPCTTCAKMLINVGIVRVFYCGEYFSEIGNQMLEEAKIEVIQFDSSKLRV